MLAQIHWRNNLKIEVYFDKISRVFINGRECKKHFKIKKSNSVWYCREIFIYKDILIKLDDERYFQSSMELRLIERLARKYRQYFPVIVDGRIGDKNKIIYGWIAEKLITPISGRRPIYAYEIVKMIENKYHLCDVTEERNWCMTKTGPIILDWGL